MQQFTLASQTLLLNIQQRNINQHIPLSITGVLMSLLSCMSWVSLTDLSITSSVRLMVDPPLLFLEPRVNCGCHHVPRVVLPRPSGCLTKLRKPATSGEFILAPKLLRGHCFPVMWPLRHRASLSLCPALPLSTVFVRLLCFCLIFHKDFKAPNEIWLNASFMSSILYVECSLICKFYFTQREEGKRNNGVSLVFHKLVALRPVIDWVRGDIMLLVVDPRKRSGHASRITHATRHIEGGAQRPGPALQNFPSM